MLLSQTLKCRKMEMLWGFLAVLKEAPVTGVFLTAGWVWQGGASSQQGTAEQGWLLEPHKPSCRAGTPPTASSHPTVWAKQHDRALDSVCKHTFHSANKSLPKAHLTGCRVIAVGAGPEVGRQEWLCPPDSLGLLPPTQVSHHCSVLDT